MLRSIGLISGSLEDVVEFLVSEEFTEMTDGAPEIAVGPCSRSPDEVFEFGECHISMALRSRLQGGKNKNQAPTSRMVSVALGLLWDDRLSRMITLRRLIAIVGLSDKLRGFVDLWRPI